ncbi:hypothetical protein KY321_03380 [Candidatus Woesearchaeota archaeon]|nr:hypothetical protein [Candidatus Woesearchaeota archaeon]
MNPKEINYLVIATGRTGSTLLMNLLMKNNLATKEPTQKHYEAFHFEINPSPKLKNLDLKKFVKNTFEKHSLINNGVKISGFKVIMEQVIALLNEYNKINKTNYSLNDFFSFFPKDLKIIRIIRKNKLQQAISLYKANKNNLWLNQKRNYTSAKVNFNYFSIRSTLIVLNKESKFECQVIKKNFKNYLTICYEELCENFKSTLKNTSKYLNIEINKINSNPDLFIQRNKNSKYLYNKFISIKKKSFIDKLLTLIPDYIIHLFKYILLRRIRFLYYKYKVQNKIYKSAN